MKRTLTRILPLLAVGLLGSWQHVEATPVVGSIEFNGEGTITSTGVTFANNQIVAGSQFTDTQNYALTGHGGTVVLGTAVTFTNFSYSGGTTTTSGGVSTTTGVTLSPNPVSPLWTFTIGATTWSFNLNSLASVVFNSNSNDYALLGSGVATETGFANNFNATWSLSSVPNVSGDGFTLVISDQTSAPLPDGGWTVALLGIALGGLEVMRRKMAGAGNDMVA